MKPVIIFGAGTIGRLAWWYFTKEMGCNVAAFCVDDSWFGEAGVHGVPVIRASALEALWPPGSCRLFVALGYQKLNLLRKQIFEAYLARGYETVSCVSTRALVADAQAIGRNCFLMEGAVVQPFARVGDNCICWSGCIVAHESRIGNHCFLAAHCIVGGMASIGDATFLGMNSTVRDAVHVGKGSLVGAGSLILQDLPDDSLVAASATPVSRTPASAALRFIDI